MNSQAVITIQSVSGTSLTESDSSGNITVFGGMAGVCTGTNAANGTATCNSCGDSAVPAKACNLKSIYGSLPITISFKSDKALSNTNIKITTDASVSGSEASEFSISTATAAAGTIINAALNWGYVCNNDQNFLNTNCIPSVGDEVSFQNTARKIYLRVDENNNGNYTDEGELKSFDIRFQYLNSTSPSVNQQTFCTSKDASAFGMCGYKLGVGDSKLYLQEIYGASSAGGAPAKSIYAPDWYGVALLAYDVANVSSISNNLTVPQIKKYNGSYFISENTITGLINYKNYCVLMGNVNKAQNIYKFNNLGAAAGINSNVCAIPSEVVGLLTDKSCFISTAAFGSDMADQVQILRQFRNEFLLTNSFGKSFVKTYYRFSPPMAHFIEQSEILKSITRLLLYPLIGLAWLLTHFNFFIILSLTALVFTLIVLRKRNQVLKP